MELKKTLIIGLAIVVAIETSALIGTGALFYINNNQTLENVSGNETSLSFETGEIFSINGTIHYVVYQGGSFFGIQPDNESMLSYLIPLERLPDEFEVDGLRVRLQYRYADHYTVLGAWLPRKYAIIEVVNIWELPAPKKNYSNAWEAIEGATFRSLEKTASIENRYGFVNGYKYIYFDNGSFLWFVTDVGASGHYNCSEWAIFGQVRWSNNYTNVGYYNDDTGVLFWQGENYVRVV